MGKTIPQYNSKSSIANNDLFLIYDSVGLQTATISKQNLFGSGSVNSIVTSGLLANYQFDNGSGNSLTDYSGNGLNGTLANGTNAPTWSVNSTIGLDFNSNNSQYVSLPSNIWFSGDYTVEVLYLLKNYTQNAKLIDIGNGQANNNVDLSACNSSGYPYTEIYGEGLITSSILVPLYKWIYIQSTLASTTMNLYINLVNVASGVTSAIPANITRTSNYIGKSNWSSDGYLNGSIAMLRIYNRCLSLVERINNFSYTKTNYLNKGITF